MSESAAVSATVIIILVQRFECQRKCVFAKIRRTKVFAVKHFEHNKLIVQKF